MSYQSLEFLLFTAGVLLLYYIVGRKGQKWVLLLANLVFYTLAGTEYLPFLLVTLLASYGAGRWMGKIYEKADAELASCQTPAEKKQIKADAKARAKKVMLLALILSVGLLAVCKYTGFVLENINILLACLGLEQIGLFKMILPLGISYYTFMAVGYVLDVYWKRYGAEKNFVLYAVFLSYFPHIVQGPIDRYNKFRPQMAEGVKLSYKNITFGAQLALWGFFKKMVIADRLAPFVSKIFSQYDNYTGLVFVIAVVFYAFQLYADFSGCVDIVSGISQMFGIKLAQNFNHPFFAKNIPDFWRRWHMSLMEWFKDYIFYPVSTSNLVKKVRKHFRDKEQKKREELFASCFPALIVWIITGIWHGAAWKYVAWGLYNALLIILGNIFADFNKNAVQKLRIDEESFSWRLWQMLRTFALCCVGRVFSRAGDLAAAFGIFKNMFSGLGMKYVAGGQLYCYGMEKMDFLVALIAMGILWAVDLLQEKMPLRETIAKQNLVFRWVLIYGCLFAVIIFGVYGPGYDASSFIYGQF